MVVRFGNVMGARGSILPLFKEQILQGGPVTITHKDMKRYYMTIPEAVSLVLKTAGEGTQGGLYLLDMGDPLCIEDMARQMIGFYGFNEEEIQFKYIGLREGEKLEETLWDSEKEDPKQTDFTRILTIKKKHDSPYHMDKILEEIRPICFLLPAQEDLYRNRRILRQILSQYFPLIKVPEDEPEY
jgi:FlaA1/EpsC-like NDP-sugar epimerase